MRRFDFDHLGTQFGQKAAGDRSDPHTRNIHDPDAVEGAASTLYPLLGRSCRRGQWRARARGMNVRIRTGDDPCVVQASALLSIVAEFGQHLASGITQSWR